jgi:hypothetical protein
MARGARRVVRGQSGVEFLVLAGFMAVVLFLFLLLMADARREAVIRSQQDELIALAGVVQQEIAIASRVYDGYSREFELPTSIGGEPYAIELYDRSELVFSYAKEEYIVYLPVNITFNSTGSYVASGVLGPGTRGIARFDGNITIW